MDLFDVVAVLIVLSALFSYLNYRYIGLPTTIGVMLIALVASLALIAAGQFGPNVTDQAEKLLERIDFDETLLHGMLAFLLFAGALHVELNDLRQNKWAISLLATAGIVASTFLVGTASWLMLAALGFEVRYLVCLLFGALISPTDPIAVLGILKTAGAPKSLEVKLAGESLFNDGFGVVVFLTLLAVATGAGHGGQGHALESVTTGSVVWLLVKEVIGGIGLGLLLGALTYKMLQHVENYQVEILMSLALVMGSYALAEALGVSAPLAVVVAGLLIGNHGRAFAMSDRTREHLDTFWELNDEILNAVLFVLIGLEVLVMPMTPQYLLAALLAVPIVLLSRLASVAATVNVLRLRRRFSAGAVPILTWAGLRGGISVALALSLPLDMSGRPILLTITYGVVTFSILVQGLTVGTLVRRYQKSGERGAQGPTRTGS